MRKKGIYVLYKGEDQLAEGNLDELSEKFKIKRKTLLFYQSPAYLKRRLTINNKNYRVLVRVE